MKVNSTLRKPLAALLLLGATTAPALAGDHKFQKLSPGQQMNCPLQPGDEGTGFFILTPNVEQRTQFFLACNDVSGELQCGENERPLLYTSRRPSRKLYPGQAEVWHFDNAAPVVVSYSCTRTRD